MFVRKTEKKNKVDFILFARMFRNNIGIGRQRSRNKYDGYTLYLLPVWLSFGYGFYEIFG